MPPASVREIVAKSRGITLTAKGDAAEVEWLKKVGFEELGHKRTYETMVFRAGKPCVSKGCNCGMPAPNDWSELEMQGYKDAGSATRGHYELCKKWSKK